MTLSRKRNIQKIILIFLLTIITCVYIYPVYLMFMNSFKPFGEIIANVLAFPKKLDFSNFTYVIKKMKYLQLFFNNVIITAIGIVGIVIFSSMSAYILDRRKGKITKIIYMIIITPMLIPFQTIMITLLKTMNVIHLSGSKIG